MTRHRRPVRPGAHAGLRNMASAAAAASGVLAVVVPVSEMDTTADASPETTGAFRLAAEGSTSDANAAASTSSGSTLAGGDLVRASGLLDATRQAGQATEAERARLEQAAATAAAPRPAPAAAPTGGGDCDLDTSSLGDVKSWVSDAAQFLGCAFGEPDMLGVGNRGNASDHPSGKALDFMTSDKARGDAIAECALANADELGVTYVIWRQRMNTGSGWETMEDRGGETANHFDHVHISFNGSGGSGTPDLGRCA